MPWRLERKTGRAHRLLWGSFGKQGPERSGLGTAVLESRVLLSGRRLLCSVLGSAPTGDGKERHRVQHPAADARRLCSAMLAREGDEPYRKPTLGLHREAGAVKSGRGTASSKIGTGCRGGALCARSLVGARRERNGEARG